MIDSTGSNSALGESVVDEVRAIRERIDEEVSHDIDRLAERVRQTSARVMREYGMTVAPILSKKRQVSSGDSGG